jgi:hypothetical protein
MGRKTLMSGIKINGDDLNRNRRHRFMAPVKADLQWRLEAWERQYPHRI